MQNPDGSYTFTRTSSQDQYNFSASGQLTSEVDRNGYATKLTYNAIGQLTAVTDAAARQLTFTYSGSHIATVTDPMRRTWSYAYDGSGNLATATDQIGRTATTALQYDGQYTDAESGFQYLQARYYDPALAGHIRAYQRSAAHAPRHHLKRSAGHAHQVIADVADGPVSASRGGPSAPWPLPRSGGRWPAR